MIAARKDTRARANISCGECTLCCTVMRVTDPEMTKAEHVTCTHCSSAGCAIYAARPKICSLYKCLWLQSQETPKLALPARMRPDRVGVVIDLNSELAVIAHCETDGSWENEPMRSWLLLQAVSSNVMLERPSGAQVLYLDGSTENLVKIGVTPGNERIYVRLSEFHKVPVGVRELLDVAGCRA